MARPALVGTPAKTILTTGVGGATVNLPASIAAGEGLVVAFTLDDPSKTVAATGWSASAVISDGGADSGRQNGYLYKIASGSEGTTLAVTWSGTAAITCVAARFTPVAASAIMPQAAGLLEAGAEDPYTFAANTITSVGANSIILFAFGLDASQRSIVTKDSALTLVDSEVGALVGDHSQHFLYEAVPGSGNAAYSNDMSDTRRYTGIVAELVGTSSGASVVPILMQQYRSRRM